MHTVRIVSSLRRAACALTLVAALGAASAQAQASPDFDAVSWQAIGCPAADLTANASPRSVDFAGDATYPAAYYAFDATYLYFRFRMDGDPSGPGGFDQYSWTALMQVPSGNPFQYQYQVSLDGQNDTIELWQNTVASDIDFSPLFHDTSEVQLFSQPYALADGSTVNTTPLARSLPTGDGSNFGGGPDYFVDFAIPVATLIANGVVTGAAELGGAVFFPATATNPSNYNKGYLNCPFLPTTEVAIDKTVDPTLLLANTSTPLTFTIAVFNTGTIPARGVMLDDIALPAWMTNVAVNVTSDAGVTWTVTSTNPLQVQVPVLPPGGSLVVELSADVAPTCAADDFLNVASVFATNAMDDSSTALADVQKSDGSELCDGADNDCDGLVDEGTDAQCDDDNPCNGAETCGGAGGCQVGTVPTCDDLNACTTDTCDPASGCVNTPVPGCVPCATSADCADDGDACTAEACSNGVCESTTIPGCVPCTTEADCADDGDACTTEACVAGSCSSSAIPDCQSCSIDAECNDANACTTDTCAAGVCQTASIPGCVPCTTQADCNDANACTTDTCTAGVCQIASIPGCIACTTAADCNDGNACSLDVCNGGACGATALPGCVPCATDADCADQDDCTTDACAAGRCTHTQIGECLLPTENCQNGTDDDGDGLIDCSDADCAGEPACLHEVCGDCQDNDHDGLVDYEDPDCCADPMSLGVSRMMLKPDAPKVRGKRIQLKTRYASFTPASFDPMTADTTLQISDASGQVFCQTVPTASWKHPRARRYSFRFRRKGFAGGLKAGRFKVRKDGSIVFRGAAKKVGIRSIHGGEVRVTLRVGNQCAQSMTLLRAKRKALVFP